MTRKKNPTVDVVEVKLAAEHEKGAKGQAETERSRQVTVTYVGTGTACSTRVANPCFGTDPDPRIHTSD